MQLGNNAPIGVPLVRWKAGQGPDGQFSHSGQSAIDLLAADDEPVLTQKNNLNYYIDFDGLCTYQAATNQINNHIGCSEIPVYATMDGVATYINEAPGNCSYSSSLSLGCDVIIINQATGYGVAYGHMTAKTASIMGGSGTVKSVHKGDLIGYMGHSGYSFPQDGYTAGRHVHYEIRRATGPLTSGSRNQFWTMAPIGSSASERKTQMSELTGIDINQL